jgi:NAD(P)H-hydrate epimerase
MPACRLSREVLREHIWRVYNDRGIEYQQVFDLALMEAVGSIDPRVLAAGIVAYRRTRESTLVTYPHVQYTLLGLLKRGLKLAVVSDAPRTQVWLRLASLQLHNLFDVVVTFDDTNARKPSPEPFRKALERSEHGRGRVAHGRRLGRARRGGREAGRDPHRVRALRRHVRHRRVGRGLRDRRPDGAARHRRSPERTRARGTGEDRDRDARRAARAASAGLSRRTESAREGPDRRRDARSRRGDGPGRHAGRDADGTRRRGRGAAIERRYGSLRGYRVHVVCGKGNNGGDGFVVARLLARTGAHVEVRPLERDMEGAARAAFERLERVTLRRSSARARSGLRDRRGARHRGARTVAGVVRRGLRDAVGPSTRVIALDLPTGLDADTGRPLSEVTPADLTVTFAHLKPAHVLYPGRTLCGAIEVVDIGVESAEGIELATAPEIAALLPRRKPTAHKGDAGKVLVVGGSAGMTGAIVLVASAALRAGAGYVTCAVPESVDEAVAASLVEAVRLPLPEAPERSLGTSAVPTIVARARDVMALALGPGLSRAPESAELARRVVAESTAPVVLDADGLNAFAGRTDLFRKRRAPLILTPHLGELSRLTGVPAPALEEARLEVARRLPGSGTSSSS